VWYSDPMDPGDRKLVHELLSQLVSVIRSALLYRKDHTSVQQMIERFFQMLEAYLADHVTLEVEVDREGLKWEGQVIIHAGTQRGDVSYRLFRDGVRLITFLYGVEFGEIEAMVKTFLIDTTTIDYQDHDLATLLWQHDFRHIRFAVVESFSQFAVGRDSSGQDRLMADVEEMKDKIRRTSPPVAPAGVQEPEIKDLEPMEASGYGQLQMPDSDRVRAEALPQVMGILFTNLSSENNILVMKALENFNILLHLILQSGNLITINKMLDAMVRQRHDALTPFYERLNSPETLKTLASHLEERVDWESRDLALFLNKLQPDAAKEMILAVLAWKDERNLETAIESLSSYFKFQEDVLMSVIPSLGVETWRNLLKSLEGEEIFEKVLYKALHNPSDSVRVLAFREIEAIPADWLSELLWDPSERVRVAAMNHIGHFHRGELLEDLKVGMTQKEFLEKTPKEKEKWFIITAMVGREEVESFFLKFFERRSLLDYAAGDDRLIYAAKALAVVGSESAMGVLTREAKRLTNPPLIRKACQDALAQIQRKSRSIHVDREP